MAAATATGSSNNNSKPTTRVRLELHATGLRNTAGLFGTSSPYAVVALIGNKPGEKPDILGQTEVVANNLNPRWITAFDLKYVLGVNTRINVGVFDDWAKKPGKNVPMGSGHFELGEILGSRGNIKATKLRNGGTLFARATAARSEKAGTFHLELCGIQLKNTEGVFGTSDPFFEIAANVQAGANVVWQPVFRSEAIEKNLNPKWKQCVIELDRLVGDDDVIDLDKPIRISVFHWQKNARHIAMGSFETSVQGLIQAKSSTGDKDKGINLLQKGKEVGKISVLEARVDGGPSKDSLPPAVTGLAAEVTPSPINVTPTQSSQESPEAQETAKNTNSGAPNLPDSLTAALADVTLKNSSPENSDDTPGLAQVLDSPPTTFQQSVTAVSAVEAFSGLPGSTKPSTNHNAISPTPTNDQWSTPVFYGNIPHEPYVPVHSSPAFDSMGSLPPAMAPVYSAPAIDSISSLPPPIAPPTHRPSFVDYLAGGCELELSIAIDFTGSNGNPRQPGTLHYIHPDGQLNDYEKAITAVGAIVGRYDSDQKFPVYGFGAKYGGVIRHCFQVGNSPSLSGMGSVLEAYRSVFRTGLTMSGPTVFADIINVVAAKAKNKQINAQRVGSLCYNILLILTDGAVSDIEQTKQSIMAATDAPLSIVIVGIGQADFSAMQFLDDLAEHGEQCRDICQFVEFSNYSSDREALTRETLAEIPVQLVDYFYGQGIQPLPPISGSQISLYPAEPGQEDIDLAVNINADGEIFLADYNGPVYDDSKYDTAQKYLNMPAPSAPISPYQNYPSDRTLLSHSAQHGLQQPPFYEPSQQNAYQRSPSGAPAGAPSFGQYPPSQLPHVPYNPTTGFAHTPSQSQMYHPQHTQQSSRGLVPGGSPAQPSQQNVYQHSPSGAPAGAPSLGQYPQSQLPHVPYNPTTGFAHTPSQSQIYHPQHTQQSSRGLAPGGSQQPAARIFHVQVPPGVCPGMQVQVQNPITKQNLIVTVPQGVVPGGKFAVQY